MDPGLGLVQTGSSRMALVMKKIRRLTENRGREGEGKGRGHRRRPEIKREGERGRKRCAVLILHGETSAPSEP